MIDQAEVHGRELRYTHSGDPEPASLRCSLARSVLVMSFLSRPVFLDQRAEVTRDYVPHREWWVF
jgi:hypothetical protein